MFTRPSMKGGGVRKPPPAAPFAPSAHPAAPSSLTFQASQFCEAMLMLDTTSPTEEIRIVVPARRDNRCAATQKKRTQFFFFWPLNFYPDHCQQFLTDRPFSNFSPSGQNRGGMQNFLNYINLGVNIFCCLKKKKL